MDVMSVYKHPCVYINSSVVYKLWVGAGGGGGGGGGQGSWNISSRVPTPPPPPPPLALGQVRDLRISGSRA